MIDVQRLSTYDERILEKSTVVSFWEARTTANSTPYHVTALAPKVQEGDRKSFFLVISKRDERPRFFKLTLSKGEIVILPHFLGRLIGVVDEGPTREITFMQPEVIENIYEHTLVTDELPKIDGRE